MTSKLYSIFFMLFLLASCSNETNTKSKISQKITIDNISKLDILYFPAFDNNSVLHLDKRTGLGTFKVDSIATWPEEVPKQELEFTLKDMEATTSIDRLWDKKFLLSLQRKSNSVVRDGMYIRIFYTHGQHKDSINVGNNYPPSMDSIILEQLNYINDKTKDKVMKAYVNRLKDYLPWKASIKERLKN